MRHGSEPSARLILPNVHHHPEMIPTLQTGALEFREGETLAPAKAAVSGVVPGQSDARSPSNFKRGSSLHEFNS